jgi:hypothetical protein
MKVCGCPFHPYAIVDYNESRRVSQLFTVSMDFLLAHFPVLKKFVRMCTIHI